MQDRIYKPLPPPLLILLLLVGKLQASSPHVVSQSLRGAWS